MADSEQLSPLEAALADLRQRRAKLDVAIEAIEDLLQVPSSTAQAGSEASPNGAIPSDAFFAMSIPDAARKYLKLVRRKQGSTEIARALERGGIQHTSKFFPNTVRTTLARIEKAGGDFVQVGKEWGLAEWYPGLRRGPKRENPQDESLEAGAPATDE